MPNTDNLGEPRKPKVNVIARIVNSHFLQSPYEGKDWESVRKDLIEELSAHLQTQVERAEKAARIDEVKQFEHKAPFEDSKQFQNYIDKRLATLTNNQKEETL